MKGKIFVIAISLLLIVSGMLAAVGGEAIDGNEYGDESVEEIETQSAQEIHDWHDLDGVRDDLSGDYVLMNDLDDETDGYEDYNTEPEDYEAGKDAGYDETWDDGDEIDIPFDEDDYDSVLSVEDEDGNPISHSIDHPQIIINEDTGERYVYVTYENVIIGWNPLGDWDNQFMGTFDGNGYEISDLYIDRPDEDYIGLFGGLDGRAEVNHVGLIEADVTGEEGVGTLGGGNMGTINNSYATGHVNGDSDLGGLVGENRYGIVENSYGRGDVNGNYNIGGLVGRNHDGGVDNSYATGNVSGEGNVGGLVGTNHRVPALLGENQDNKDNLYATSKVNEYPQSNNINLLPAMTNNSYATGNVSGDSRVGGLVGANSGTVENSYASGDVSGDSNVGGLVGWKGAIMAEGVVRNSHYNIDEVLINGENHVTRGGLFDEQYQDWMGAKELDIADYSDTLVPSNDHYEISCVDGLRNLLGFADSEEYKFRLTEDIDLSDEPGLHIPYLAADFDGDDYTISNLYIDMPFATRVGMFGEVGWGVNIANISIVDAYVTGEESVGGLVGWSNRGTIEKSYVTAKVIGEEYVASLVGWNYYGLVLNSYATGEVSGDERVGGLVGRDWNGAIKDSYAEGEVSGDRFVGGLVGINSDTVSHSYATGEVSGDRFVGGLVGMNSDTVSHSYATGNVSGGERVGGLVGSNRETVENSYATGDVTGCTDVGGLVGHNRATSLYEGTVSHSYATGEVSGEEAVGGLVGNNTGTVSNSVWDVETSGIEESDGGTGKTTAEMKNVATYTDTSTEGLEEPWDFVGDPNDDEGDEDIWDIDEEINDGYPFLTWAVSELTIEINGEGSVDIDPDQDRYIKGTTLDLTADPDDGWYFVEWTGDVPEGEEEEDTINVIMDDDKEITAVFEEEEDDEEEDDDIPGFTSTIMLISALIAVAIYKKKKV